ncbi:MAG: DUF2007 domain-containing protein [Cytophagaceae bacterium]|nr:DUF2007 domain-containing protein [Cytophagaceae bacterium]
METIILKRFDSPVEANIVKGLLESNDIFCFLQDEHSIGINPLYANALGGIKLMVRVEDGPRANALLLTNSTEHKVQCPQCGFHDVHDITENKNQPTWFSVFVTLFSRPISKKTYECSTCKNVFVFE